ncbi:MAG TPA: hypothetical protein VKX16_19285 [Chloroflexota bacterium]|nr:hypothetical protein [Chloroflexota bacterium]
MDEVSEATRRNPRAVLFTIIGALVVLIATILYTWAVTYKPAYGSDRTGNSAVQCTTATGQMHCTVHLQIQPAVGVGPHADYLGYITDTSTPHPGTILTLPRNALVTVIVRNFDSRTALRNPFFTLVQGTIGGQEFVNGKPVKVMSPDLTSHTFTIPDFGVSVPMEGIPSSGNPSFETMKFTFRTPNRTGVFRWQCIVPCGYGLYGNGGPMGELGYMGGLITLT